jgi:hypothetical protein
MDTIVKYLQNPLDIGVYDLEITANFSAAKDYFEKFLAKEQENFEESVKKHGYPDQVRKDQEELFARYSESVSGLEETFERPKLASSHDEAYFRKLTGVMRDFSRLNSFPEKLGKWFYEMRDLKLNLTQPVKHKVSINGDTQFFDSRVAPDLVDVLSVDKKHVNEYTWLFDVITIKKDTTSAFKDFLEAIPPLEGKIEVLKERKQCSSRYVFRPYALATKLWLQGRNSLGVPTDLKSFLTGASTYLLSNEWRTSIVLSAIGVESMLADLYEETYRTLAPDTPLSDLYRLVKEKITFPPDITKAIETTNEARISAVHRSRLPVSEKEALNALWGATCFTLWYISNY